MLKGNKISVSSMPFRVFIGGTYEDHTHEREQMGRILMDLYNFYKWRKEWCAIFIDIQIEKEFVDGGTTKAQIDGLIVKENRVIILEMKDKEGEIEADLGNINKEIPEKWIIKTKNQEPEILERRSVNGRIERPPFEQVNRQRGYVAQMCKEVLDRKNNKEMDIINVLRLISGFVIFKEIQDSSYKSYNGKKKKWFKIIQEDELMDCVSILTSNRDLRVSQEDLDHFSNIAKVPHHPDKYIRELLPINEDTLQRWYMEEGGFPTQIPAEDSSGAIIRYNKIIHDLKSDSRCDVKKAIKTIMYLGLFEHIEEIRSLRNHPDPNIRLIGLETIIELEDGKELTEFLLGFVDEPYGWIRKKAIEELIVRGSSHATPKFIQILEKTTDHERAMESLSVLEALGDERAIQPLIIFAEQYEIRFADHIDESVRRLGLNKERSEILKKSDIGMTISNIIKTLGEIGQHESVPFLIECLNHDAIGVRLDAIKALGQSMDSRVLKPLLSRLENVEGLEISYIITALGEIKEESTVKHLHKYIESEDEYVKDITIEALRNIQSKDSYKPLLTKFYRLIENGRIYFSDKIVNALSEIGPKQFETDLLILLKSDDEKIKRIAAKWIEPIASENSIDNLIILLNDDDIDQSWYISKAISKAIKKSPEFDGNIPNKIIDLLDSKNEYIRQAAVMIVGEVEGEKGLDKIIPLRNDSSEFVREAVIVTLGGSNSERAIPYLIEYIEDNDSSMDFLVLNNLHMMTRKKIGKYYAIQNKIPLPKRFEKILLEEPKSMLSFENFEVAAFYWGELILNLLEKLTTDKSEETRMDIARACWILETEKCIPILEQLLSDDIQDMAKWPIYTVYYKLGGRKYFYGDLVFPEESNEK